MEEEKTEFLFVFKDGGWWLKITDFKTLFAYYDATDDRWGHALLNIIKSKEFGHGMYHINALGLSIGMYGVNRKLSALKALQGYVSEIQSAQIDALLDYGAIYINKNHGWHFPYGEEGPCPYQRNEKLAFPDFSTEDIKIERFPLGQHFYAYVGNVQVRVGDKVKWNTYDAAKEAAEALVGK